MHRAFDKNYHFIAQGFHHLTRSCFPQPSEQYVWERQTIVLEKVSFWWYSNVEYMQQWKFKKSKTSVWFVFVSFLLYLCKFLLLFLIYTLWETCAWWASSNAIVFFFLFFFPWLELAHLKFYLKVVIVFLKIFSFVSIYCQLVDQSTHSTFSINPHLASLFYCLFCFC